MSEDNNASGQNIDPLIQSAYLTGYMRGYYDAISVTTSDNVARYGEIEKAIKGRLNAEQVEEAVLSVDGMADELESETEEKNEEELSDAKIVQLKEEIEAEIAEIDPEPKKKPGRPKNFKNKAKRKAEIEPPRSADPPAPETPVENTEDNRPAHERLAEAIDKDPNLGVILGV